MRCISSAIALLFLAAESEELCLFLALNAEELAGTHSQE
jgi:hypothetical protein